MKITLAAEDSRLSIDYLPACSLATVLSGIEIIHSVGTESLSGQGPEAIEVYAQDLSADPVWSTDVHSFLRRGNALSVRESLGAVTEPTRIELSVRRDGRNVGCLPLLLVPPWAWLHAAEARVSLAALVVPGDEGISNALTEACALDAKPTVLDPARDRTVLPPARALYEHLRRKFGFSYEEPRSERDVETGITYQIVRPPETLLSRRLAEKRPATCLDLSLLFAGLLEAAGHSPLVVLSGRPGGAPEHAFAGCWIQPGRRFRPILTDRSELVREMEQGHLSVFEATGLCSGARELGFSEAEAAARRRLRTEEDFHAIDIAALRPPTGRVHPLISDNAPLVRRALWLGQRCGETFRASRRESLHLLYGLCAAGGEATGRLLDDGGGRGPATLIRVIESHLRNENHDGPPKTTRNYQACLATARWYARKRGSSRVEEADLLWAVLGAPSSNIRRILELAGHDPDGIPDRLMQQVGRAGAATFSRAIDAPDFRGSVSGAPSPGAPESGNGANRE